MSCLDLILPSQVIFMQGALRQLIDLPNDAHNYRKLLEDQTKKAGVKKKNTWRERKD